MSNLFMHLCLGTPRFVRIASTFQSRILLLSSQNRNIGTHFQLYANTNVKKPIPNLRKNNKKKPFVFVSWISLLGASIFGGAFLMYMFYLQEEKDLQIAKERKRQIGKAAIGGKFELINSEGKLVKSDDFLGKWVLIYFGFTHCPDVCPDELEKLSEVVNKLDEKFNFEVQPLFISVDPARDTPEVVGKYIKEFSPKIIGLTGSMDQVAATCKAYRIYFSSGTPDDDNDYIVDHTILIYLIDPDGAFVDYYGQLFSADQIVSSLFLHKFKYDKIHKEKSWPSINLKGFDSLKT